MGHDFQVVANQTAQVCHGFITVLFSFPPQKHQASFPFRGHCGSIHRGIHRLRAGTLQQGQLLTPGCMQGAEAGGEEDGLQRADKSLI